jgi:hypothetical protein
MGVDVPHFNRKERRALGLRGGWNNPDDQSPNLLRYVRRHYKDTTLLAPATRRERKARARIIRSMRKDL